MAVDVVAAGGRLSDRGTAPTPESSDSEPVGHISFSDQVSGDDGYAQVRVAGGAIGLALSLRANGDLELFLVASALDRLCALLEEARSRLERSERCRFH
jgi:hypothetical protein